MQEAKCLLSQARGLGQHQSRQLDDQNSSSAELHTISGNMKKHSVTLRQGLCSDVHVFASPLIQFHRKRLRFLGQMGRIFDLQWVRWLEETVRTASARVAALFGWPNRRTSLQGGASSDRGAAARSRYPR